MEKDIKFQEFLVQNNLIQFNNVNVTDRNLISHQCLEKLYWEYISSSKGSNLLNFGLELEMGKDIPNYINGSGFVKMGCLTSIDNGEFKRYPFLSFDLTDLLKSLAEPIINGAV